MTKRLGAPAILVAAVAAGLLASTSNSADQPRSCDDPLGCRVALTGTGPSIITLEMYALGSVHFYNPDSVSHTVVFANGLCSLTVAAGDAGPTGCSNPFMVYAGSYAYTVDGKFPATVVTRPLPRSVSLTARTRRIRGGTRLILHGEVMRSQTGAAPPPPVVVLARHNRRQAFEPVATVRTRGSHQVTYGWKLEVRPGVLTTYVAEVTAQRLCYYPASRCAHPQGQVWVNAKSRPFTVRVRR